LSRKWNICQTRESGSHRSPDGRSWADRASERAKLIPDDAFIYRSMQTLHDGRINSGISESPEPKSALRFTAGLYGRDESVATLFRRDAAIDSRKVIPRIPRGETSRACGRRMRESRDYARACQARRGGGLAESWQSRVIRKPRRNARRDNATAQCARGFPR